MVVYKVIILFVCTDVHKCINVSYAMYAPMVYEVTFNSEQSYLVMASMLGLRSVRNNQNTN